MKKYFATLLVLVASQTFALDKCLSYPIMNGNETNYRGVISEISDVTSFAGCPASVLVNVGNVSQLGEVVNYLVRVIDYKNEKRCIYGNGTVMFMCQK